MLVASTRLGLTSFGGPIAHLGYFREEYVTRRGWLDGRAYADLVALCQFLPGPASSQVGIAIGVMRAGLLGGVVSGLGFTLPSALMLMAFAYGVQTFDLVDAGWLHGLKVAAVAVVAFAVWGMARTLAPDRTRATIAITAAVAMLAWQHTALQVALIAVGGIIGWRSILGMAAAGTGGVPMLPFSKRLAVASLTAFALLLVGLPILRLVTDVQTFAVLDSFYRVGALVFGGGHVVLPLLQTSVVTANWVTPDEFTAGYGAAQAIPGPLFAFSAYLGAVMGPAPNGVIGAAMVLIAIYVPSFLLVIGVLPFWNVLRTRQPSQAALLGINAVVVGLLLAALYHPVWTSAIFAPEDFALGLAVFALLAFWRLPPWIVVALAAVGGQVVTHL